MKIKFVHLVIALALFLMPAIQFAQTITLGSAANFVLFTSVGAITNVGPSHITGDVGSNSGAGTGFGNVNGNMQSSNGITALAAADLATAYGQLNTAVPAFFPALLLGNGSTLTAGVYSLSGNTTLNNTLTLNAQGTSTAVFIFQINGTFAANANATIILTNGALACNVFWKVEGAVSFAAGSSLKGNFIANNSAITLAAGSTLEGRVFSTAGAIGTTSVLAYTPIGCGSTNLTGPGSPTLASTACYAIFSSDGAVTNVGVSTVTGDIGSNNGSALGFNPLLVSGSIHAIPDLSTSQCAVDLGFLYTYLNTLPADIILLFPAQFGNNLVLTPHTYLMNGGVTLTDSLYLNAQGNPNAVFVIQINGALSTSAPCKVILINGTQAKNVFWKVDGAVSLNAGAIFKGTIVANNGAILFASGVILDGRALTTTGAFGTSAVTVTIPSSIDVTSPPTSQTVCAGSAAVFSVSLSGNGVTYQWRKGTINIVNGGSISGATTGTLSINPAILTDASALYNVIISGGCGMSYTSPNVSLVINGSASISAQPGSQTVCAGSAANFSVSGSGAGLTFQWRNGIVNLVNAGVISGVTTATLVFSSVSGTNASANYNLIVSGVCAPDFTSALFSLVVNTSPTISAQVPSQTVCPGSSVTFSVNPSGTGLTYQWRNGNVNLINGGSISGATSPTLTLNPVNTLDASLNYNLVINGVCAPNYTSSLFSLVVNTSPTISAQVPSQTVCAGSSVTFSVNPSGTGLSYQWRNGNVNLINGGSISGATSPTLILNPVNALDGSLNYNLVITGVCAPNYTSSLFSLVVNTSPTISAQVASQTVCAGSSVTFSVNPSGTGLSYQWRNGNVNLINGGSISGATSPTLILNPVSALDASLNYNLVITGVCAPNYTSSLFSLVVNTSPTIIAQVASQTVCAGTAVSFSVNPSGTGLTYQWRKGSVNLINGGAISGATSPTLIFNPAASTDGSANYNLIISGVCAPNYTSSLFSLVVNTSPTISAQVPSQTVCAGSSVTFSVNPGGTGLSYQWRNGTVNLINGGSISGATSPTLTLNPVNALAASSNYNLVITGVCAPNYTSSLFSLVVNTSPTISAQVPSQTVCAGSSVTFSVNASGTGLSYQWRNGTVNLINGGNVSGATSPTLTLNPVNGLDASSNYNLVINGVCASNYTSSLFSLVVNTSPTISAQIASQTVCAGSSVTFSVNQNGTGLTYQWRNGTVNLINGGSVSGANSPTLIINPVSAADASSNYNLVINGTCAPNYTSANTSLVVNQAPALSAQIISQTACAGAGASLKGFATGTALSYQWRKGNVNLVNGGAISGATTATLNINPTVPADAANNYNVVIAGVCSPNFTSANVSLAISPYLVAVISVNSSTANAAVCVGASIQFSAETISGANYNWTGPNSFTSTLQNPMINPANLENKGTYVLLVSTSGCAAASATSAVSVVNCVSTDFFIPEGFSPNADGINDLFVVRGIGNYPNNKFMIFNRWGISVFEEGPYQNDWDGRSASGIKMGGDELPVGTYFYVLDLGDGSHPFKGTIYLNR